MRSRSLVVLASLSLFWAGTARADVGGSSSGSFNWSGDSGTINPPGSNVFTGGIGFPGLSAGIQHGMSNLFDVGGRLDIDYAPAYDAQFVPVFEANFLAPLRFHVFQQGMMNLVVHVDPGLFIATAGLFFTHTSFGLAINPGAVLTFDVLPQLKVGPTLDLPMGIDFLNGGGFTLVALFGGVVEWMVIPNLSIGMKLAFGLTYSTESRFDFFGGIFGTALTGAFSPVQFALEAQPTISYKF